MTKKNNAGVKYFGKPLTDDPDDAPELLGNFFRHGELHHGGNANARVELFRFWHPNRTSTIQICRAAQYYYIAKGLLDHLISGNKQRLRNR